MAKEPQSLCCVRINIVHVLFCIHRCRAHEYYFRVPRWLDVTGTRAWTHSYFPISPALRSFLFKLQYPLICRTRLSAELASRIRDPIDTSNRMHANVKYKKIGEKRKMKWIWRIARYRVLVRFAFRPFRWPSVLNARATRQMPGQISSRVQRIRNRQHSPSIVFLLNL